MLILDKDRTGGRRVTICRIVEGIDRNAEKDLDASVFVNCFDTITTIY